MQSAKDTNHYGEIIMDVKRFQQDLRNGMTISDALQKHQVTFKEAVDSMPRPMSNKQGKLRTHKKGYYNTNQRYIGGRSGHYYLRKQVRGKTRMFGTYKTIEDAVRMREHCEKHGWKERSIDQYCKELGITRCVHHNKRKNKRYS